MSHPALRAVAAALAAVVLVACGSAGGSGPSTIQLGPGAGARAAAAHIPDGDWTRFDFDAARSGVGPADTGITAADIGRLRLRTVHIDGVADSSAIQLHGIRVHGRRRDVAIVTTSYGRTIAFDPGTGRHLWEFVPSAAPRLQGTPQITQASPVADPDRRFVYTVSPDGLIHKLSVASGRQITSGHWPVSITFNAHREKVAPALNISGSLLLVGTGGYIGDAPVYQGHVVAISRRNGRIVHVWNALCSDRHALIDPPSSCPASDAAIWARAGVVVEPGTQRLLVATGNGPFNGSTDWGDSVLELSPNASRLLQNWTPTNQAELDSSDTDVGSTDPAVLPVTDGMRLAVQGGKAGVLDLLDLNNLNGTGRLGRLGGQLQQLPSPGGGQVVAAPAVWSHAGRVYVFVSSGGGTNAYTLDGTPPRLHLAWSKSTSGSSPVLAGGLLYIYDPAGGLNVRDPVTGALLATLPAPGGHWNSPIVIGGRIILPVGGSSSDRDSSGEVLVYHLPGR